MERIAFIILIVFCNAYGFAQDTIFKRNNDTIIAKVLEINSTEVKYKKFNFQDGPVYVDAKTDVEKILFSNGMKQTFEKKKAEPIVNEQTAYSKPIDNKIVDHRMFYIYHGYKIGQPQMQSILMDTKDKKIMSLIIEAKKARRREPIFIATFPLVISGFYSIAFADSFSRGSTYDSELYYAIGGVAIAAGIACPVISIASKHKKMNCNSAAIKLYNEKF